MANTIIWSLLFWNFILLNAVREHRCVMCATICHGLQRIANTEFFDNTGASFIVLFWRGCSGMPQSTGSLHIHWYGFESSWNFSLTFWNALQGLPCNIVRCYLDIHSSMSTYLSLLIPFSITFHKSSSSSISLNIVHCSSHISGSQPDSVFPRYNLTGSLPGCMISVA